jgi:hypothetical protein
VFLDEDWADEPAGFSIPLHGTPFKAAPRLPQFSKSEPVPRTEMLPKRQDRPEDDRQIFERLGSLEAIDWPAGLATSPEQQASIGAVLAAGRRDRRLGGAIHWRGPLPKDASPGCRVRLVSSRKSVAHSVIFGLKQVYSGRNRDSDWIIQLGRLGPVRETPPNLRPAEHLWPARVVGDCDGETGALVVAPIGWHKDSRLSARILSAFAGKEFATVSAPRIGDLGLIGFEGGSPDAPVWLGSLHDAEAPDAVTPEGAVRGAARFGGGGSAQWTVEPVETPRKISIDLKGIGLELTTDSFINFHTKSSLEMTAQSVNLEAENDLAMKSNQVTIKSNSVRIDKKSK